MKKACSLLLALTMTLSLFSLFVNATENTRSGIEMEYTKTNGVSHPVGYYNTEKRFDRIPVTFEAWVYLPSNMYSQRGGVILGNYTGFTADDFVNFEIHKNGVPRLLFCDSSGTMHDFMFSSAKVPANRWTHIAIVYGTGTSGKQIFCYINGVKKQATNVADWYEAPLAVTDNQISLAGDLRPLNDQAFRGKLGNVAVYADVRTPEEVVSDYYGNTFDPNDKDLIMYYDLSSAESKSDVPDLSKNGYDMKYYRTWLSEDEMEEIRATDTNEYEYIISFMPDIQYMTQNFPDKLTPMFDYLVNEKENKNIQYVISLGDITHTNSTVQWRNIKAELAKLGGKVPYSLVCGNHDTAFGSSTMSLFDLHLFSKSGYYYSHVNQNGGCFKENSARNTYLLFSVGEIDYLILNLDFGATDDILTWADGVLNEHADRRVIIATHGYLNMDGTTLNKGDSATPSSYLSTLNDADMIWDKFVSKHENIDMIVSGHILADNIICTPAIGDNGNTVYQFLMDPQSTDKKLGGLGILALMYFTKDGNHARVEYYSTVLKKYFRESNKEISLDFSNPEDETTVEETTYLPVPETTLPEETTAVTSEANGCGGITLALPAVICSAALIISKKKKLCV